ncbi:acetylornithine transaminase [Sutcliffiella horikoshii]|uniref:Acetylornithine aminotransferase n=2 Tax=Sutcliffiella horikoshii TaxID=79883 RepID=A0A5D4SLH1_9BACI|nr:acetylornithine transaminase [Sutcliffiella horikoshii]TYS62566.1 acetylornithine transaminase [Sutcliffiella horikoshii]
MSKSATDYSQIMNTYSRLPLSIQNGKGTYVWSNNNEKYLDFTSGIATCNLGHCPPEVEKALKKQLSALWHTSNLYHVPKQEELARLLVDKSCFDQVFFCNSGAEANEAAIKLVRAIANNSHKKQASIVTFQQSFHGRTLATVAATGQEKIKSGFEPMLEGFIHLSYNDYQSLQTIRELKPTAVMLELLQGEGGVVPAEPEWVKELSSICKEYGILLVIDEVQTGMGRTGSLFLYEQYDVEPDIMTLAKGLGSGFPIGAMLAKEEVARAFKPGMHGSTFGGNPLACTAGIETLKIISEENFLKNITEQSQFLHTQLESVLDDFSFIKEKRGKGMLIGLEIDGNAIDMVKMALEEKLLLLSAGPNVVRLLPPLTISQEEVISFIQTFIKVLQQYREEEHG